MRTIAGCLVETASIDVLDRDGREVDAFETANINAPQFRSHARTTERQNSAGWAEIIFGSPRMPLIERKLFDRRQWTKTFLFDAMDKRASETTDRTVADPNMIEIGVNFEPNLAAVTGALVWLFHADWLNG